MIKKLYSIYDKKLERYNLPGFNEDDKECMLSLQRAMYDKNEFLFKYRDDLACYCLGEFDDKTGILCALPVPRLVCDISSLTTEE